MPGEEDDLKDAMAAAQVADALKDGDLDAFVELADLLKDAGVEGRIFTLVFGTIWELMPEDAQEKMVATAEAEGKSNVIDLFARKPRE